MQMFCEQASLFFDLSYNPDLYCYAELILYKMIIIVYNKDRKSDKPIPEVLL